MRIWNRCYQQRESCNIGSLFNFGGEVREGYINKPVRYAGNNIIQGTVKNLAQI